MNSSIRSAFIMNKRTESKTDIFIFLSLLFFFMSSNLFSQVKRDTVWVGYDKMKSDSLITWDGKYIGTAYAHPQAGWSYALKMDLTDFGTDVSKNDFYPTDMKFYVLVSRDSLGVMNRQMTAYVWDDSSGFPGKVSVSIPFTLIHRPVQYDTAVVIDLRASIVKLRKKNPLWIGFVEGPTTDNQLYTLIRSSYSPGKDTRSFDKTPAGQWSSITQPIYYYPELRKSYNLYFQVRYIGDHPLDVDATPNTATSIQLKQNYPNPFSSTTSIQFVLPNAWTPGNTSLRIFDLLGREVISFDHESFKQGLNDLVFSSGNLPNGMYHYVLTYGKNKITKALVILH